MKLFGSKNLKKYEKKADSILELENEYINLSTDELKGKTDEFRRRLKDGETLEDIQAEAFAAVREAARRTLGMTHFRVQLIGGMVMHEGKIAEMYTGEGKTLTATLPAYLNALEGKGAFVVTVNDYLAERDASMMGEVYGALGMTTGIIKNGMSPQLKKKAYACDITYGTNNEFGFDYLRDNMALSPAMQVQRGLHYALVDEVDSVLIDEARTPLIISSPGRGGKSLYESAARFCKTLKEADFEIEEKLKTVMLTEEGLEKAESFFHIDNIADLENIEIFHAVHQALHAEKIMKRDKDYLVKGNEVVIVDEFTGRQMPGRRYSNGLHQAIEAKEGVEIMKESKTMATITFQNFFRLFDKLSGMTGTAKTEEEEFNNIYGLRVVEVPTNRPIIRKDMNDIIFKTEEAKFKAVAEEIGKRHKTGQPILVGTVSIDKSEYLSGLLKEMGIGHKVLNAKHLEKEAEIVSRAGEKGAVTISTNMAGRGTDIKLGEGVAELGGLYVIGTERHESRRIDNQLRGRSGRQGDPGETRFYLSLDDSILRIFGGDRLKAGFDRFKFEPGEGIENRSLTKSAERAQKRVESRNYDTRKKVLEYDNVLNRQREIMYGERQKILEDAPIDDIILKMTRDLVDENTERFLPDERRTAHWDLNGLGEFFRQGYIREGLSCEQLERADCREKAEEIILSEFRKNRFRKQTILGKSNFELLQRQVLLKSVDRAWTDHIDNMDTLRQGIGLRAYAQNDPVQEYAKEGFELFEEMNDTIRQDVVRCLYDMNIDIEPVREKYSL